MRGLPPSPVSRFLRLNGRRRIKERPPLCAMSEVEGIAGPVLAHELDGHGPCALGCGEVEVWQQSWLVDEVGEERREAEQPLSVEVTAEPVSHGTSGEFCRIHEECESSSLSAT